MLTPKKLIGITIKEAITHGDNPPVANVQGYSILPGPVGAIKSKGSWESDS